MGGTHSLDHPTLIMGLGLDLAAPESARGLRSTPRSSPHSPWELGNSAAELSLNFSCRVEIVRTGELPRSSITWLTCVHQGSGPPRPLRLVWWFQHLPRPSCLSGITEFASLSTCGQALWPWTPSPVPTIYLLMSRNKMLPHCSWFSLGWKEVVPGGCACITGGRVGGFHQTTSGEVSGCS